MIVTNHLKRLSRNKAGTVLHTRMYLAVSAGLNRIVSVRNTVVTHDGRYPLRLPCKCKVVCSDFPLTYFANGNL